MTSESVEEITTLLAALALTPGEADEIADAARTQVSAPETAVVEAETILARQADRRNAIEAIQNADECAIGIAIIWEAGSLRWRTFAHREGQARLGDHLMMLSMVQSELVEREKSYITGE